VARPEVAGQPQSTSVASRGLQWALERSQWAFLAMA